ncbi:hypothetical protein AbraIFM66951_010828 [Aspergillus brasiliensis]|uniref:Major facilitator superfamily (MFS) profile domain-containing protein n=1 Tax=Aspergillus brasiliensis TaxID=319629 RepID=A0A9W6DJN8_9EURO|nr:hypothetical protein AbraCBS73388_010085 [Aspergillus brasiliensis]GKZ47461.1 hypothetical protein AbraIFM66951_010828 [Aspergillus brasiliensis]
MSADKKELSIPDAVPAERPAPPHTIFDKTQRRLLVAVVSTAATFSTLASNIYFPAVPSISHSLNVSTELVNLSITAYLIFQGLAPSLWGPISDTKGRRTAYIGTLFVAVCACIGLAETKNYAMLVIFRCLQSTGSASTVAIGSGVIGDITTREDRGGFMGFFQGMMLISIAIGPVIGGALAGSLGWRYIFWFLTAYSGVLLLMVILLLPETLRSIVGNGSRLPSMSIAHYPLTLYQRFSRTNWRDTAEDNRLAPKKRTDLLGPLRILISKQAAPLVFFFAIYFAVWQMTITAMSTLFKEHYGLTEIQSGLTFIANGAGSMVGTLITGKILDRDYRRVKERHLAQPSLSSDDEEKKIFPLERARLRLVPIFAGLQCLSVIIFGWTIQYSSHVHIAVPIITTFITGWTAVSNQSIVTTYLVDVFYESSAAANASLNMARCCLAAAGSGFVMPLVKGVGCGVAFTICVAAQGCASVGLLIQWRYGGIWRSEMERKLGR